MERDGGVHVWLVALMLGIGGFLLANGIAVVVSGLAFQAGAGFGLALLLGISLGFYGGFLTVYYLFVTNTDRGLNYAGLQTPVRLDLAWIAVGFAGLLAANVGLGFVAMLLGFEPPEHSLIEALSDTPEVLLYLIPVHLLVVATMEELVYRGLIQSYLRERYGAATSITGASVIFALVHFDAYVPEGALGSLGGATAGDLGWLLTGEGALAALSVVFPLVLVFGLSLILGYLYERTGNLFVPIAVHGLYNSLLSVLAYLQVVYDLDALAAAVVTTL